MNKKAVIYKSNSSIVYSCRYHVVFATKYRYAVLVGEIDQRIKILIAEMCERMQSELYELEVMPDHIHLLVECDPQFGIAKLIKNIKTNTSRILRDENPKLKNSMRSLWTTSCLISTVSEVAFETIQNYIKNQKNKG